MELIDIVEDNEGSEDGADSIIDLRPEEERDEPDLLTGQTDSEEEKTSLNSVETDEVEEEAEVEEEEIIINVSCNEEGGEENTVSCLDDV